MRFFDRCSIDQTTGTDQADKTDKYKLPDAHTGEEEYGRAAKQRQHGAGDPVVEARGRSARDQ